jgi:hypothetical protein
VSGVKLGGRESDLTIPECGLAMLREGCLCSKRCISRRGSECRNLPVETFQRARRCTSHSIALVIALNGARQRCMH